MSASLSDILTTQKNGVVAINTLNQTFSTNLASILTTLNAISTALGTLSSVASTFKLFSGPATTSYVNVYTVPASTSIAVTDIDICNTSNAAVNVYVSLVPSAGSPGASNALFYQASVPAFSTLQWTGTQGLNAGDSVQVYASTTAITFNISGAKI